MHDQLLKDENEWEQEFADIPNNQPAAPVPDMSQRSVPKFHGKLANMTDFSGFLCADSPTDDSTDMSIGRYFLNRCQDLREIITATSPTKHVPVSLVTNSTEAGWFSNEKNNNTF